MLSNHMIILQYLLGRIWQKLKKKEFLKIYSSNERIELTNHRLYHQILHSPYLFALARQNVTCNW
jgi:hypothetical protein